MGELAQRLVSISDSRASGEPAPAKPQQAHCGEADQPNCMLLPTSAVSVISCNCHKRDNLHVQVTIKCPCSRPSTAEVATQTEPWPVQRQQPKCAFEDGGCVPVQLKKTNEKVFDVPSIQLAASAANRASSPCGGMTQNHAAGTSAVLPGGGELATKLCDRERSRTSLFPTGEEFSPRLTPDERRRSVQEALAHVRETLFEVLRETPRAVATTSSTAGIFATMFPVQRAVSQTPSPSKVSQEFSPINSQTTTDAPAVTDDTIQDQTILESVLQESLDPRVDTRRYLVSEGLCAIYEHIEERWAEVCGKLRAELNGRYDKFLADCRSCLEDDSSECEREQLRKEMSDARRELMAEMKELFRSSCDEFDEWRVRYLESELQQSCSALQDGDRLHVMDAVLRYEILEGLPELEKRTRERAAALWKELVEQRWVDVDAIFDV